MKTIKASVYTVNKNDDVKFEKHLSGEVENNEAITAKGLAKVFAGQIWKAKKLQDKWQKAGGTQRALGLAKGARLVFFMEVDGVEILNTEMIETTKLKVTIGENTLAKLERFLELFFEYTMDEGTIELS